jgi:hypothetical protein
MKCKEKSTGDSRRTRKQTAGTKAKKCKEKISRNYGTERKKTTGTKEKDRQREDLRKL